ncbi:iron ABC transporter permease [Corynebacterium sp.]|uniref:FecCD family ABC transporter permease n=1 Tax=Corynebacterium sp. TaxID=1720 RepID=UPI002A919CC3|nr:iron ABC transporter permease [Corynebacterium sp.]MDY5786471.1 iron ABC transporter permease [Corynebacterium sp.]
MSSETSSGTARPGRRAAGLTVLSILVFASITALTASLFIGSRSVAPGELLAALGGGSNADIRGIVWDLRVPRTLLAYAVGAALAVAGLLAQSWTRNPLADPGFIGVTAGASFAVALGTVTGVSGTLGGTAALAFLGAAAAAFMVTTIAHRSSSPLTLILIGVGVDAALRAAAMLIGLFDTDVLDAMRHWTVGSTFGRGYADASLAWIGLAVGATLAALAARPLDLLSMGEETSLALGGSPRLARALAALGVVVLAGSATAAAGPVVFVGFAAPHLLRPTLGPQVTRLLLPSALLGGIIVLLADIIGRVVARPGELEMSIVVALIGAPVLIAAVRRGTGWRKGAGSGA